MLQPVTATSSSAHLPFGGHIFRVCRPWLSPLPSARVQSRLLLCINAVAPTQACLVKDAVCEANINLLRALAKSITVQTGDFYDEGSVALGEKVRISLPWGAVLPSAKSRVGQMMRNRLTTANVWLSIGVPDGDNSLGAVGQLVGAHCAAGMVQHAYREHLTTLSSRKARMHNRISLAKLLEQHLELSHFRRVLHDGALSA